MQHVDNAKRERRQQAQRDDITTVFLDVLHEEYQKMADRGELVQEVR